MSKLIEKINKLNLTERFSLDNKKIALIAIIGMLVLYIDFNFLLKSQMAAADKSKAEVVKISNDLKVLDAGIQSMQAAKAAQKSAPKAKGKKIIYEPELTALLHDISKLANANNVRILQIKPIRDTQKAPSGKLTPVAINMDLICGYHNFGKFINSLENNQAFMAIESFKIEAQPQDALRQKVSLTVKTYVRK
ncbi:MAG: type 4a pilus biogenesis protein PilO [Candidatus Omnitrophica bacterium]|nr:type 4a pilus biogenesis protein PilO [Candidatus Omnitrophota bacterium]